LPQGPTSEGKEGKNPNQGKKKKVRSHPFPPFVNAYTRNIRPTLIVSPLINLLCDSAGTPSEYFTTRLKSIFAERATGTVDGQAVMTAEDVNRWLVAINGRAGRGSEFRAARAMMLKRQASVPPEDSTPTDVKSTEGAFLIDPTDQGSDNSTSALTGYLTYAELLSIYHEEMSGGKFWSVRHDLGRLGRSIESDLADRPAFNTTYDHLYISCVGDGSGSVATESSVSDAPRNHSPAATAVVTMTLNFPDHTTLGFLPHATHPSDHTPIGAAVLLL
jgi:hypothetical protein